MDSKVVKNSVGFLEKLLLEARGALWQLEAEAFGWGPSIFGGSEVYEDAQYSLEFKLQSLHDALAVVLEAAEMPETRSSLVRDWKDFSGHQGGIGQTIFDGAHESLRSPVLTRVQRMVDALRATIVEEITTEDARTLERLETMLNDTPALLRRRGVVPTNEHDVQRVMHDYMGACFPDFTNKPVIAGSLKHFVPDCGLRSVNAAIEFKFVRTAEEMAVAFSGIAEDSAGYKGSKDWTRFYAVIYQLEPFTLHHNFHSDLERIGAKQWKALLVHGFTQEKKIKKPAKKKRLQKQKKS